MPCQRIHLFYLLYILFIFIYLLYIYIVYLFISSHLIVICLISLSADGVMVFCSMRFSP